MCMRSPGHVGFHQSLCHVRKTRPFSSTITNGVLLCTLTAGLIHPVRLFLSLRLDVIMLNEVGSVSLTVDTVPQDEWATGPNYCSHC